MGNGSVWNLKFLHHYLLVQWLFQLLLCLKMAVSMYLKNIPSFDWVTESARKPKYLHGFIRMRWSVKGIVYYICVELREIRINIVHTGHGHVTRSRVTSDFWNHWWPVQSPIFCSTSHLLRKTPCIALFYFPRQGRDRITFLTVQCGKSIKIVSV